MWGLHHLRENCSSDGFLLDELNVKNSNIDRFNVVSPLPILKLAESGKSFDALCMTIPHGLS
jgi:hypothetical protein